MSTRSCSGSMNPALLTAMVIASVLSLAPREARAQCILPPGHNQTRPCTDAAPPSGTLSPGSDVFSQPSVPVTITWGDDSPTYVQWIRWNGADVTSTFEVSTWRVEGYDGEFEPALVERGRATGTVLITPEQPNTVEARVCDSPAYGNPGGRCSTWSASYALAGRPGVEVTAKGGHLPANAADYLGVSFTVRNTGTTAATYALSAQCTPVPGSGTFAYSCAPQAGSLALNPGTSAPVSVFFHSGAAGAMGTVRLTAVHSGASEVRDLGWTDVTVIGTGATAQTAPVVNMTNVDPGTATARDHCVTASAGAGAAYECGDLRLVHPLPTTTTYGRARAPALIYNSQHAHPRPTVYANVTLPAGSAAPTSVRADLTLWNGSVVSRTFTGSEWHPGTTRRIAVQFDAQQVPTGIYGYSLQVTNVYGTAQYPAGAQNGQTIIVNRANGPFGPGWWVAGLEQIIYQSNGSFVWIGGDGSTRWYTWAAPGIYVAASVDRPDTLRALGGSASDGYIRPLPGGAGVYFNGYGQHVMTRNRLDHRTHFHYWTTAAPVLRRIVLPAPPGTDSLYYHFTFDHTVGRLTAVDAPGLPGVTWGRRYTYVHWSAWAVDSIRDPDNGAVRFGYGAAAPYRVIRRTDRRQIPTTFAYDGAGKLSSASLTLESGEAITQRFEALEGKGLTASVALAQAYTRLDGPRTDVQDHTDLWLNRWGAPTRVRDALGRETVVARTNLTFPALATEVTPPSGVVTRAWYNGRALVDSVMVVNPLGTGASAVTRYTWHPTWHSPTSVSAPGAAPVTTEYDPNNGNVLWQQQGDATRRVYFDHNALGQLVRVRHPHPVTGAAGGGGRDSLGYDALGNLRMTRTPLNVLTLHFRDALGRDTLTVSPTAAATAADSAALVGSAGVRQRTEYDVMDRPRVAETIGPAITQPASSGQGYAYTPPATPQERLRVETLYNGNGQPTEVTRQAWPDPAGVGLVTTYYGYDNAGRLRTESGTQGAEKENWYDLAGNVIRARTGLGAVTSMEYDVLGRLVRRSVPGRSYPRVFDTNGYRMSLGMDPVPFPRFPTGADGAYVIPAEESYFRYDAAGNQVYAENADAIVRRSYYPNGALRGDTLYLRDYGTPEYSTSYGLEYAYDIAGRVQSMKHPQNLAGTANLEQYGYDPVTGALSQLTSRFGSTVAFQFENDKLGRPLRMLMPGGVVDSAGYDADGRRTWHAVRGPGGPIMSEAMHYDGRGKLWRADSWRPETGTGVFQQWYSGIGNLAATDWQGIGTNNRHLEEYVVDALGNVMQTRTGDGLTPMDAVGNHPRQNRYAPGQARVVAMLKVPSPSGGTFQQDSTGQEFDAAGNEQYSKRTAAQGSGGTISETRQFYGADQRLRAFQRVEGSSTDGVQLTWRGVWEEYRYDPLGRRIMVRTRTDGGLCNADPWTCTGSITRYLWAGDQILWELRAPGNAGANLEATDGSGAAYGRVSYTHAGGIDRPLVITKNGVSLVPHQNWRGMFALATGTDGYRSAADVDWPGYNTTPWHGQTRVVENWFGSLSTGMRDASGQMYMRNRYYDPASGQFTQPDPIGLAGGLNSYGFAAGDPVSYRDPFGLKVICMNRAACQLWSNLVTAARTASASSDRDVAAAGRHLIGVMHRLQADPETLAITVQNTNFFNRWGAYFVGVFNPANATGACRKVDRLCPAGASYATRIDPNFSGFASVGALTRAAHELGHAHARMVDELPPGEKSEEQAVESENSYRTIQGCSARTSHKHGDAGPPCN